jgi:ubiquinone/menaquinone biosynthesis C-methylase UbiE
MINPGLNAEFINEGIYVLSEIKNDFEEIYLKVREKEKRIYSDNELILLPFASSSHPHKNEWNIRAKSFLRFKEYLKTKKQELNILDLGCGNGWFCGQLSKSHNANFYCVDVNLTELKQAGRVFSSERIKFFYGDIFSAGFPENSFDIITINAAVQYFPDLKRLIERLFRLITESGEIHILDSPFYSVNEVENARKRTSDYYNSLGFPEMRNYYHHHTLKELSDFKYKILYQPNSIENKVKKIFSVKDSPFPWINIKI